VPDSSGAVYDGQESLQLGSGAYDLAAVNLPDDIDVTAAAHEMGNGFGLNHSRALSTSDQDYNDCTDIMSAV
jgi:hypothetical protein